MISSKRTKKKEARNTVFNNCEQKIVIGKILKHLTVQNI